MLLCLIIDIGFYFVIVVMKKCFDVRWVLMINKDYFYYNQVYLIGFYGEFVFYVFIWIVCWKYFDGIGGDEEVYECFKFWCNENRIG